MSELPLLIAVTAGMLAVLNPCGFAMLPGYLALLLARDTEEASPLRAMGRAVATTAAMTSGFVVVFGGFALAVTPLAVSVEPYLPWLTIVIGLALCGLGVWLLAGRQLTLLLPKFSPGRPTRSLRWAFTYGLSYAVASLSCTVGPFLALVASALRTGSVPGVLGMFLAYTVGMGMVIGVLTIGTALARDGVAHRLRRLLPHVTRASGALLLLAGSYVAYYGIFELRTLAAGTAQDPVIGTAIRAQAALGRWLAEIGPGWVAAAALLALVLPVAVRILWPRRTMAAVREPSQD
ncbi:cytochrome c biogenesis CcdA family protein [Lipingzhangella sp. LS1_29]|uniref:Cytochrome c biogenesis CcdA family protein n=1 Tax=Lipingzhangella rawalii TaxID=2055835 RepID=A0ABU2H5P5_9ACTN|nr:cytochrome c biogenesis CcdA family protein [Lipingzhangella rawalii]MDS1270165.1 cytochrome c biogenesis CcdA family protein [Lipingzhangella rawalii]